MTGPSSVRAPQARGFAERCRATTDCTGTILDGYCTVCANALLQYVGSLLNR